MPDNTDKLVAAFTARPSLRALNLMEDAMHMRIVWGRILPGKWNEFEAAFKTAMANRGALTGLVHHWLAQDQADPNAGYSVTIWDSETNMQAFWNSQKRREVMAPLEAFYINQFTVTNCAVKYALHG